MTLEEQVVSLELAKRLKELGVKQESYFHWSYWTSHPAAENSDCTEKHWELTPSDEGNFGGLSAFTVAELGEMMPPFFHTHRKKDGMWYGFSSDLLGKTEADARAKMLIDLIENKLIKAEVKE